MVSKSPFSSLCPKPCAWSSHPMMGNLVGMFKDTSFVAIVGLLDLTGMANNIIAQTEFLGLRRETFMFIAIFYFIFSYVMAAIEPPD